MRKLPEQVFGRENHNAGRVEAEEDDLKSLSAWNGFAAFSQEASVEGCDTTQSARNCLDYVGHDADSDEEARHVIKYQRCRRRVRVFEGPPHFLAHTTLISRSGAILLVILAHLVVEDAFGVLAFAVAIIFIAAVANDVRDDAEECQLFVVTEYQQIAM